MPLSIRIARPHLSTQHQLHFLLSLANNIMFREQYLSIAMKSCHLEETVHRDSIILEAIGLHSSAKKVTTVNNLPQDEVCSRSLAVVPSALMHEMLTST